MFVATRDGCRARDGDEADVWPVAFEGHHNALAVAPGVRCDISKFGIILSADFPLKGNDTVTAIMGILNAEDIVARVEHEA